jgi:acid phosphatase (class A)
MKNTLLLLSLVVSFSAFAGAKVMELSEIKNLIGDFPAAGSALEKEDDRILLNLQNTRTEAQCRAAHEQEDYSVETYYGDVFTNAELVGLENKFKELKKFSKANVKIAKDFYKRPRPFVRNRAIIPCIELADGYSYPSGHSTIARLSGKVFAQLYPKKAEQILKAADQAALNRVLGGVHHPSDIEASRILGDELALRFLKN